MSRTVTIAVALTAVLAGVDKVAAGRGPLDEPAAAALTWQVPVQEEPAADETARLRQRVAVLEQRVRHLERRLGELEQSVRPDPALPPGRRLRPLPQLPESVVPPPEQVPEHWIPFHYNGVRYYIVPLHEK